MISIRKRLLLLAILFFSWLVSVKNFVVDWTHAAEDSQSSTPPNILLIVADDLGYDDTSAINSWRPANTEPRATGAGRGDLSAPLRGLNLHAEPGGHADRTLSGAFRLSTCRVGDPGGILDDRRTTEGRRIRHLPHRQMARGRRTGRRPGHRTRGSITGSDFSINGSCPAK